MCLLERACSASMAPTCDGSWSSAEKKQRLLIRGSPCRVQLEEEQEGVESPAKQFASHSTARVLVIGQRLCSAISCPCKSARVPSSAGLAGKTRQDKQDNIDGGGGGLGGDQVRDEADVGLRGTLPARGGGTLTCRLGMRCNRDRLWETNA
ncbi:uncharacterized protein B0I36DRAFT_329277 [Microdochium trichocladiopsis]|uniref:Uncharacterized protein n=1 Tax=Microdochium trichocladiopsis TaxID=1682393 RepID=A0A9P8Y298_9PEZI|nr:uncharacterized protein B0I36DRAFT_329277 [Microdochium trichocladiopsis]KAH7025853.1 hypothetical protein B0I36DRAFT_329277 [Microdochium trichocladiopsis]